MAKELGAVHEAAIREHLAAQGVSVPEGMNIGQAISLGFKVIQFVTSVAAGGPADAEIKGINIGPAHGALTLHWTPRAPSP